MQPVSVDALRRSQQEIDKPVSKQKLISLWIACYHMLAQVSSFADLTYEVLCRVPSLQ